jgi:large subunit ribosomal protein L11
MANKVEVLVDGGKATPGNPLGPALGPLGLNVMNVVKVINEKTAAFQGMKVPVTIDVDAKTKNFTVTVGTPPTSALIFAELKIEKGSGTPKTAKVGNLTVEQCVKISRMKQDSLNGATLKARVSEVAGTANSCGVTIEGMAARDFQAAVKDGKYDSRIK